MPVGLAAQREQLAVEDLGDAAKVSSRRGDSAIINDSASRRTGESHSGSKRSLEKSVHLENASGATISPSVSGVSSIHLSVTKWVVGQFEILFYG
jgi:hypothetical protein